MVVKAAMLHEREFWAPKLNTSTGSEYQDGCAIYNIRQDQKWQHKKGSVSSLAMIFFFTDLICINLYVQD